MLRTRTKTVVLLGLVFWLAPACDRGGSQESTPAEGESRDRVTEAADVVYFYSEGCPDCLDVTTNVLPLLKDSGLVLRKVSIDGPEGFEEIRVAEEKAGRELSVLAPVCYLTHSNELLAGPDAIRSYFVE